MTPKLAKIRGVVGEEGFILRGFWLYIVGVSLSCSTNTKMMGLPANTDKTAVNEAAA